VESETKVTLLAGGQGNISGGSVAKPVIKAPTVEFNDHGTFNLGTHSVQTANLAYGVTTQLQGNGADRPHIFGLSQSWFDSFGNFTPETWKNNIAWKFYSVILQAANSFDLWISSRPTSDSPNANSNSSSSGVDTERADNGSDPFLFTKRNDESELLVASGMTQESGGGTTVSNPIIAPIVPTELEKSIDNSLKRVLDSVIQELGFGSLDSPEYSSWLNSTFFNNVESMLASALVSFSSDAVLPDGALDTIIQKVGSAFKGKDAAFSLGKDLIVAIITEICSQIMHSAAGIPDEPSTNSQIWGDYLIQVACGVIKATLSSTNPAELQFNLVKEQVLVTINQAKTAFDKSKQYTETIKAAQESSLNLVGSWARASITQETAELAGLSHAGDMAAVTERIQEQFTDPYFLESLGFPGFGALKNTFFPADDQYREACADLVNDMAKLIAAQAKGKSISSRDIAIIVSKTKKFGVNLSGGLLAMNAVLTIAKEFLGEGTAFLIEEQLRPPDNPNNNPSVGTGSELQEERRNPLNNYQPTPWYMK
jgi:hypothetical protein